MNSNNNSQSKRENIIEWDDYFMAMALLAAKRSKDPISQVGACIVNEENRIVGVGYNGMPNGCSDDLFPWGKNTPSPLDNKHLYVCHAEMNAIMNSYSTDLKNCRIYVTLCPCNECAKLIIQSGIKEVVYLSDRHAHKDIYIASSIILAAVGIQCRQYKPKHDKIEINIKDFL